MGRKRRRRRKKEKPEEEISAIGLLPDDVIGNILVNFTVKELCRLKLVSRSWSSLIDLPDFRNAHRNAHADYSRNNPILLVSSQVQWPIPDRIRFSSLNDNYSYVYDMKELSFPITYISKLHFVNTCLELVCMYYNEDVCVCNPTTRDLLVLPNKSSRGYSGYMRKLTTVGFGYIPSSKKYKVIRFSKSTCDVFTIAEDTDRWRIAPNPPFSIVNDDLGGGVVYSDGGVHMLSKSNRDFGIARFDLDSEKWTVVKPPPVTDYWLCEFGGFLCAVKMNYPNVMSMWLLKNRESSLWVKEYTFTLPARISSIHPLVIEKFERIVMKVERDLVYFDKEGTYLGKSSVTLRYDFSFLQSSLYVESFFKL